MSPSSARAKFRHFIWKLTHTVAALKAKLDLVIELKGKLEAVLTLLGQGGAKSGEVTVLPDWRGRRHVA